MDNYVTINGTQVAVDRYKHCFMLPLELREGVYIEWPNNGFALKTLEPGLTFDYAVPETWLDLDDNRDQFYNVRGNGVWIYPKGSTFGEIMWGDDILNRFREKVLSLLPEKILTLSYGLQPPMTEEIVCAWGCRGIQHVGITTGKGFIDIVYGDFQGEGKETFEKTFYKDILFPWIQKEGPNLSPRDHGVVTLHNGFFHARMSTNASHGYVYVGAWMEKAPDWVKLDQEKVFTFVNAKERDKWIKANFPDRTCGEFPGWYNTPDGIGIRVRGNEVTIYLATKKATREDIWFDVFHLKSNPNIYHDFLAGDKVTFPEDYYMVARVMCLELEDAFRLTNNIDGPWQANSEVQGLKEPCRSTSVGDVILDDDNDEYQLILPMGYRRIKKGESFTMMDLYKFQDGSDQKKTGEAANV